MLVALLSATLTAGCGSAKPQQSGSRLFATSCGQCHSLTGVDSPTHQGGDLLRLRLSRAQLLQFTREMPVRHPLTPAELSAVTSYVLAAERRG